MITSKDKLCLMASTQEQDEHLAVADIARQLRCGGDQTILFFCSSRYDLDRLKDALHQRFADNLIGCTSAGLLGPKGYQRGGLTAVGLHASAFAVRAHLIRPLATLEPQVAQLRLAAQAIERAAAPGQKTFALLLVDGLSMREEILAEALHQALPDIPLTGGSAGDDLRLRETHVWCGGSFYRDAAVVVLVTTALPFGRIRVDHFVPGPHSLVVTESDPKNRVLIAINGQPAAHVFADRVGEPLARLDAHVFSRHPLLLERDGAHYVRAIQRVDHNASLRMFSAVTEGSRLSLGEPRDPLGVLEGAFKDLAPELQDPQLVIGFDCVLRRLEFEQRRIDGAIGQFMANHNVIGFCTYGEQFDNAHVNQTFTGVALSRL